MRQFFLSFTFMLFTCNMQIATAFCLKSIHLPEKLTYRAKLSTTSQGVLLKTENNLYKFDRIKNTFNSINEQSPLIIWKIHDTPQGVYLVESETQNIYKYRYNKTPEKLTLFNNPSEYIDFMYTNKNDQVYIVGKNSIKQLQGNTINIVDNSHILDDNFFIKRPRKANNSNLIQKTNGSLFKVVDNLLTPVLENFNRDHWHVRQTDDNKVFIWENYKIYQIDGDNNIKEVILSTGESLKENRYINNLFVTKNDIFFTSQDGLFRQSSNEKFYLIKGADIINNILGIYQLESEIFILGENGVFKLTPEGISKLNNSPESIEPSLKPKQTIQGVLFVDSLDRPVTYQLTKGGSIHQLVNNDIHKIYNIFDTTQGIFISTKSSVNNPPAQPTKALYRLSNESLHWVKVPSEDLEGDIKVIEGVVNLSAKNHKTVFVHSSKGIFQYHESPLDQAELKFKSNIKPSIRLDESLGLVKWSLLNFPCDDVAKSIQQKLVVMDNDKVLTEIDASRTHNSSEYPWSAEIDRTKINAKGNYILKVIAKNENGNNITFNQKHKLSVKTSIIKAMFNEIKNLPLMIQILISLIIAIFLAMILIFLLLPLVRKIPNWIYFRKGIKDQIFINYRRDDTGGYAYMLYEELERQFYKQLIFFDLVNLRTGRFPKKLSNAIKKCTIVLVIIGPDWLNIKDESGKCRLEKIDDYVRMEIEWAIDNNKEIIPILVGNATIPEENMLPGKLKQLLKYNIRTLSAGDKYVEQVNELAHLLAESENIPSPKFHK